MKLILNMEQIGRLLTEGTIEVGGTTLNLKQDEPNHYATGAEIKEFYTKGWDDNYYYEPDNGTVQIEDEDGEWILEADSMYDLRQLGTLEWQGGESKPLKPVMEFEDAFLHWKANRPFEIEINGRKYQRKSPQSYHDIVSTWGNGPAIVSVMYQRAPGPKPEGSLCPGQSTPVTNGTRFEVADTSNA